MTRRVGHVVIRKYDTLAECLKCGKRMQYRLPLKMTMWKEMLKAFVRKHRTCNG